ncbi:MAG: hypothetical protein CMN05_03470 [Roseibacillus sp.]|jgi:hypothetical protein|nr:hypothetical protein [Roseibacillus sp.]MBP34952.1 hypothetical protein [Roseibacillus sp.]
MYPGLRQLEEGVAPEGLTSVPVREVSGKRVCEPSCGVQVPPGRTNDNRASNLKNTTEGG